MGRITDVYVRSREGVNNRIPVVVRIFGGDIEGVVRVIDDLIFRSSTFSSGERKVMSLCGDRHVEGV